MCLDKLKTGLDKHIKKEKNIKIRERTERRYERSAGMALIVLMAGNWFASTKSLYSVFVMSIIVVALLIIYLIFENMVIPQYSKYTDELIRKSSNKNKRA